MTKFAPRELARTACSGMAATTTSAATPGTIEFLVALGATRPTEIKAMTSYLANAALTKFTVVMVTTPLSADAGTTL
ncbi:hypothetical protein SAMN04488094_110167 [Tropicimonas isoalkanivorans]|uniref:Uncharacterized protein n=1 Tax=Tropicimonas isoalkanivorans TaxID=441112 RepID=A0A1I1MRT2_9RHOB|nr:hypothetical protein SAMN04488094_110167 [Tropicimonas isoalkanivorans]